MYVWQVIGNAVIKQQHPYRSAMVLQMAYIDPKLLVIGLVFEQRF